MFESHLDRVADGSPIITPTAHLLPVLRNSEPAMLKLSHAEDERMGGILLERWDGEGAVRVLLGMPLACFWNVLQGHRRSPTWPVQDGTTKRAASCALPLQSCTPLVRGRYLT